jgi:hypothetical protein
VDDETRALFHDLHRDLIAEATEARRRFDTLDQRIGAEAARTRPHFDVVAESLRSDITLVIEGLEVTRRSVAVLRTETPVEFRARDAVLHAGFSALRRDIGDIRQRL